MRIFITGATGLIGRRLVADRLERGDEVIALTRSSGKSPLFGSNDASDRLHILCGDPSKEGAWQAQVDGCDVVVNLAGAGVADRRWTSAYKKLLIDSRIYSTRNVSAAIKMSTRKPSVLVSSSAIGFYGETGATPTDEHASPGADFLAQLCVKWEAEARNAACEHTRVALMRLGVVLDPEGGALREMLKPFKFFIGGPMGSGRQSMSWIHWRDLIGMFDLAFTHESARGPINVVAPKPISNLEFSRALGKAIHRPCWLPAPKFGLRIVLGEFAKTVTMSQCIIPEKAKESGYEFKHP
ncbi:MAG: TIGR01777 family oxidoreductase, partial [Planctomycetota bacterium]|nr:TIGR01777 family oxidoreductase [Planctomycetota bacterium]